MVTGISNSTRFRPLAVVLIALELAVSIQADLLAVSCSALRGLVGSGHLASLYTARTWPAPMSESSRVRSR